MTPPDTSEFLTAANAGLPLGEMVPATDRPLTVEERWGLNASFRNVGDLHTGYDCGGVTGLSMACVCIECARPVCTNCFIHGRHGSGVCRITAADAQPVSL